MGMNIESMLYLQERGYLTAERNKLLDIGPQNVYYCTEQQVGDFVRRQGTMVSDDVLQKEAKRLEYFSTPRPGERTTYFSEIADLTNIQYRAFDVCPAPKTELLDLNFDLLPAQHFELYDVVLNFGTTEHIFNQWNCFAVIHDAAKVGGIIYCVLPATGYLDHGYFCYTPLFFRDLAHANEYNIVDQFFAPAGLNVISKMNLDVRVDGKFSQPNSGRRGPNEDRIFCFNAHVVMQKATSAPFRCGLEVATAHSSVDENAAARYQRPTFDVIASLRRECLRLERERDEARAAKSQSLIRRIYGLPLMAPVRALRSSFRTKREGLR
jgi:hypothetical protein